MWPFRKKAKKEDVVTTEPDIELKRSTLEIEQAARVAKYPIANSITNCGACGSPHLKRKLVGMHHYDAPKLVGRIVLPPVPVRSYSLDCNWLDVTCQRCGGVTKERPLYNRQPEDAQDVEACEG